MFLYCLFGKPFLKVGQLLIVKWGEKGPLTGKSNSCIGGRSHSSIVCKVFCAITSPMTRSWKLLRLKLLKFTWFLKHHTAGPTHGGTGLQCSAVQTLICKGGLQWSAMQTLIYKGGLLQSGSYGGLRHTDLTLTVGQSNQKQDKANFNQTLWNIKKWASLSVEAASRIGSNWPASGLS